MASESQWVDDEMVVPFRLSADFEVRARDYGEARDFIDTALDLARRSPAWIPDGPRQGDMGEAIGIDGWEHARVRPQREALGAEARFPGMVNDLALVETLREMRRSAEAGAPLRLPDQLWERLSELREATNPELHVNDPDHEDGREIYLGAAAEAAKYLTEGVYQAWSFDDQEYALVVTGSELTDGRVSAAFPRNRRDARVLDEIGDLLHRMDRTQSPAALLREIDRRVAVTGRSHLPSWLPMDVTPVQGPATVASPTTVHVGVIVWSEDTTVEPSTLVDRDPVALTRRIATLLHENLAHDADGFAGATDFLDTHPGPQQWVTPEDVDAWLDALQAETPTPAVSIQQFALPTPVNSTRQGEFVEAPRPVPGAGGTGLLQMQETARTFTIPVDFTVSAHSTEEARLSLRHVLSGEQPDDTGATMSADVGVLAWAYPRPQQQHPVDQVSDLVHEVLAERSREVAPHIEDGIDSGQGPRMGGLGR